MDQGNGQIAAAAEAGDDPAKAEVAAEEEEVGPDECVAAHPLSRTLRSVAARMILQGVADIEDLLGHGLGSSKVRMMVHGSRSALVRREGLDHLPLYGCLAFAGSRWLEGLIEQLIGFGYIERLGALRPVVRLTARGEQALFEDGDIPALADEEDVPENSQGTTAPDADAKDEPRVMALFPPEGGRSSEG
ncbi:MAG: hypothetical protein JXP34_02255 [Planctomycetes bacterium]|nr:hypothetical protein [Planctomycetota bacterium]